MFAFGTYFLQQVLVLVVCHGLAADDAESRYFLVKRPTSWGQSQEFCKRHFVDLAVMSTEKEYYCLQSATAGERVSFWIGLQRSEDFSWVWVDGEDVHYDKWRENKVGDCGSFEAMLLKPNKMLSRFCEEPHASVCQGPVAPQDVSWVSCSNCVSLSWNVSAFMQMTSHSYTVTACASECIPFHYRFSRGASSITVHISNLTSATNYTFEISASVTRPDHATGRTHILQSSPTTLHIQTGAVYFQYSVPAIIVTSLKCIILAPSLWIIYLILKKGELKESNHNESLMGICVEHMDSDKFLLRTRAVE